MRTIGIWIFGSLACGITGALIDAHFSYNGGFAGLVAGLCAFACIRLWIFDEATQKRQMIDQMARKVDQMHRVIARIAGDEGGYYGD